MQEALWAAGIEETLRCVGVDPNRGLSQTEAAERLRKHGPNLVRLEKRSSRLKRLAAQFRSPVILTLIAATAISLAVGDWIDAVAILAIVILNAFIGYFQEAKAEAAIEALKKLAAPKARVLRNGSVVEIPAREIVPGDILVIEAGDYVAADARVISASQLAADEAVLTGESLCVEKNISPVDVAAALGDRTSMLFADTVIASGSGRATVIATGMGTEIGKIAGLIETAEGARTPLQAQLEVVGRKLLGGCVGVVAIVALIGLLRGRPWLEVMMTAISLAVAAIPEGLPTVVTLALALAVRRMVRRNAIVRHLPAVETLGSTDVICTDKTGTLTTGKMRVREIVLANAESPDSPQAVVTLLRAAALCSNASLGENGEATGDATEVALLLAAREKGGDPGAWGREHPRIAEWSFDSRRKRMSVAVREPNGVAVHVKGAPESVLPLCKLNEAERARLESEIGRLSRSGRRLLAIASRRLAEPVESLQRREAGEIESELECLGVVALADPPRPESIAAIEACRKAGIEVVMITGDHPVTAEAIAAELGIVAAGAGRVVSGPQLDAMSDEALRARVPEISVYARVSPEHKLRIIRAWQALGKVVAMTGDGVNDAPALKAASIGVAMGKGGTEVARQASSMILTDDNFATIVSAVEEGRGIYGNIRRTIHYLLTGNLCEILIMFGAAIVGWPAPLQPLHLLWINLVTDGFPSLALAAEPVPARILETTPRPSRGAIVDRAFFRGMTFIGLVVPLMALSIYGYQLARNGEAAARTYLFTFFVFEELFRSFSSRSDVLTFVDLGARSNLYLLAAVAFPMAFQLLLPHVPFLYSAFKIEALPWTEYLVVMALALIPVTVIELRKIWHRSR